MPDNGEKLYKALAANPKYKNIGKDYDSFRTFFSDEGNAAKLYSKLKNDPQFKNVGRDLSSFADYFGLKKKVSGNDAPSTAATSGGPSATSQNKTNLFETPDTDIPTVLTETGEQIYSTQEAEVTPSIPPGKIKFTQLLQNLKDYKQGNKAVADFADPRLSPLWQQTHKEAPERDFVTNAVKSTLDFAGDQVPVRIKNAWEKGKLQGEIANILPMMSSPDANADEAARDIASFSRLSDAIPQSEEAKKLESEGVVWAFKNPLEGAKALGEIIISSLSAQITASERTTPVAVGIGAGAGSVVPGIGTAAGAVAGLTAGQIVAGMNVESSSIFLETLKEAGFPVNDEEALKEAFKNPALIDKARSMGIKRGVPIAIFDLLTAGLGGRLAARTTSSLLGKVGKISAVAGVETAGGSAGEFAAQVTSGQEIDANAIALEGVAQLGAGSPALASEYVNAIRKRNQTSSSTENIIKQVVDDKETGLIESKQNLDRNLQEGIISEADHAEGLVAIEKVVAIDDKIPLQIKGVQRQKSIELIGKRDEVTESIAALEEQKASIDPAYHPVIDQQIEAAGKEVESLNKEVAEIGVSGMRSEVSGIGNQVSGRPTIKKNDLVTYTDAEGNMSQVPVESVSGDKAVIGVNKDGIYERVEVELGQIAAIGGEVSGIKNQESRDGGKRKAESEEVKDGEKPEDAEESSIAMFKLGDNDKFYHASPVKRKGRLKEGDAPQFGKGVYFSTNKDLVIDEFGTEVTEVQLKVTKPLYVGTKEEKAVKELAANKWNAKNLIYDSKNEYWTDQDGKEAMPVEAGDLGEKLPVSYYSEAARELGYDVIIDKESSTYENEIVVLDESKIIYPEDVKESKPANEEVQEEPVEEVKAGIKNDVVNFKPDLANEVKKKVNKIVDEYLYHGTGEGAFRKIREYGLISQKKGTHLYFADIEQYARTYAQRKGNTFGDRVLRVRKSSIYEPDENTGLVGDYKTLSNIKPSDIEISHKGKWIPIQEYSDENIGIMPIEKASNPAQALQPKPDGQGETPQGFREDSRAEASDVDKPAVSKKDAPQTKDKTTKKSLLPEQREPQTAKGNIKTVDEGVGDKLFKKDRIYAVLGGRKFEVSSLEEASAKQQAFFEKMIAGREDTPYVQIDLVNEKGVTVAHISQNGRVWLGDGKNWKPGTEPIYKPGVETETVDAEFTEVKASPRPSPKERELAAAEVETPKPKAKRKPTKTVFGERKHKVLGQEPRNRREAILDYFVGGGRISVADFKRFTGFSIGKPDGRPYIGFVKKNGTGLDKVLEEYGEPISDGGDIGSANDIIETLLEFGGSRNKMLAEMENLYKVNQPEMQANEMTDEEAYYYGTLTDAEREQVDLIRNSNLSDAEINAILDQNQQDELSVYDEYIDELTFEADRVKELADILDQFTDANGKVDWDAIYDEMGDAGLSELSNIEKINNGKQDQKPEPGTESEAAVKDDGGEKNTAAAQAGAFIENRIKELDGLIKDQKQKIENKLAGLSKGNDMFAASGVDDGSKNTTLFEKSATNTKRENIKRITGPLNAELDRLIAERDNLKTNKEKMVAEASAQQEFFNTQPPGEDARIVMNGLNPLPALIGSINKFQERHIAQNARRIEDWLAAEISMWGQSKNYAKRNASHLVTSIFNGIPRSKENITGKLLLSGGFNKARFDASKLIQQLYDLVGSDLGKIEQVHEMLDPDLYASLGVSQGPRLGAIPLDVQMLHDELRDLLDSVHRRNFALGFIDQATYDKHKGKYVPRLYETFEIPEDVQQMMDEQEKYHPVTRLDLGQFKGRKELDALSQQAKDDLLKDPVYGAVKRLMQLDQNAAIAGYIKQIMTETPHLVITPKAAPVSGIKNKVSGNVPIENLNKDLVLLDGNGKEIKKEPTELEKIAPPETGLSVIPAKDEGQDIPPGYQLMSGKGYGKLDGKYVPNYIAEDFKGYFMLNGMLNKGYEFFKAYDRLGFRQFLKKSYTVFNPIVQLGNFISNFTFAFSAGIDPVTFASGIPEAYKNLKEESNEFQTLLRHGILGSDIVSTDLMPLKAKQGVAAKKQPLVIRGWNAFDEATTKMYGMSDDLAKMNAFLMFKKQGFTQEEALRKVYEGFQNYATVGKMWDTMSKAPLIGNPFLKFTADLFRIMKNGAIKTPLTTAMYVSSLYMMPQIMQVIGLSDGEEDENEEELRTSRNFIPKVPLGFTDIPLVYKTRFGEVNLARYLSPFYLFDTGNDEGVNNLLKKFLPVTLIEKQEAGKGNVSTLIGLSDPLLGTAVNALFSDTDFRGKSIKDPEATRFRASGATNAEQIQNKLTYLGRSWIPQGAQMHDFYLSQKYGEDFYGRTKTMAQSLMNMVVKVQAWDDSDYKKEASKRLDYSLSRMKSLGDERKNIGANILAKAKLAATDLNEKKITQKQYDARVSLFSAEAGKRLDDNQKQQEKIYQEIEAFATKYKAFLE